MNKRKKMEKFINDGHRKNRTRKENEHAQIAQFGCRGIQSRLGTQGKAKGKAKTLQ